MKYINMKSFLMWKTNGFSNCGYHLFRKSHTKIFGIVPGRKCLHQSRNEHVILAKFLGESLLSEIMLSACAWQTLSQWAWWNEVLRWTIPTASHFHPVEYYSASSSLPFQAFKSRAAQVFERKNLIKRTKIKLGYWKVAQCYFEQRIKGQ